MAAASAPDSVDEYIAGFPPGWKKYVGLYPVPRLDDALEAEVAPYRAAKDSVNFPYAKPIPYDLIERLSAAIVTQPLTVGSNFPHPG